MGRRRTGLSVVAAAALAVLAPACDRGGETTTRTPELDPGSRVEARLDCAARTADGALGLVPDAAEWIAHVGPRQLLASGAWSFAATDAEANADYVEAVGLFSRCGLTLAELEHVRIGFDGDDHVVVVASGPGLGEPERGACLVREAQALLGEAEGASVGVSVQPWAREPQVGVITLPEGQVFLFGGDVLAYASAAWVEELERLAICDAVPATRGASKPLLAEVDQGAPIWVVARVRQGVGIDLWPLLGVAVERMRAFVLSVRFDDGIAVSGRAQLHHEAAANVVVEALRVAQASAAQLVGPRYAPLVERIEIVGADATISVAAALTEAELATLLP